jgi:predicted nucleotidyltransferase
MKLTAKKIKQLAAPVFEKNENVLSAYVFGSFATGHAAAQSDIDFLVEFSKNASLFDDVELYDSLKEIFKRNIDIADTKTLYHEYKEAVMNERIAIYEKKQSCYP